MLLLFLIYFILKRYYHHPVLRVYHIISPISLKILFRRPNPSSSPSPISRTKEPTLRQLQIRHSNRIKRIRKHRRTPPIRHRVTWIADCEEDDDTRNSCASIQCCGEDILGSLLVTGDGDGGEQRILTLYFVHQAKKFFLM
jgi:hypothetical protein